MIGHIDCDCFYVSAERVRHAHLRGLAIGVLGNHGACIIAKSYEMKAAGVTTGMPIWEAVPICPEGIYIKRDFNWYESLSRRLLSTVKTISPLVEYYSVDEMFFKVDQASLQFACDLQTSVLSRVGVPTSVGIAPTKTLAKIASSFNKPLGTHVISSDAERQRLLCGLPVTKITGIARRSANKLAKHGITTCDQFIAADSRLIRKLLTVTGEKLWYELNGESVIAVTSQRPQHKFIARGGSLGRATDDRERLQAFIARNTERLIEALNYYGLGCDQLILDLSFKPAGHRVRRANLLATSWTFDTLAPAFLYLLDASWSGESVHYMHVVAGKLRGRKDSQTSLFPAREEDDHATDGLSHQVNSLERDERDLAIDKLKHAVNESLGRFALRSGATLPLSDVYADPANAYDICDIYGKSCF